MLENLQQHIAIGAPMKWGIQERKELEVWVSYRAIDKTSIRGLTTRTV